MVPAAQPITVFDLLTSRAGYGSAADFSLPAVATLIGELKQGPPHPQRLPPADEWMATLAGIPLLHQPGQPWQYDTCSDIQGVLVARASGQPLAEFLAERLFEPLGMADTAFQVPAAKLGGSPAPTGPARPGRSELVDGLHGQWSSPPAFPAGAGGLVSTVDDRRRFARMLLAGGTVDGRRLLSPASCG